MTLERVEGRARADHLAVFGAFHPEPADEVPEDTGTLILLGPDEPGFWPYVTSEQEFSDGKPDALDRWSERVITRIASEFGGTAYFPFGGPPWRPFIAWAKRTGRAWESPVTLLVHDRAGLMVSYRGAIGLQGRIDLPAPEQRPCDSCVDRPCLSACPVFAITSQGYDIPACKTYLKGSNGEDCVGAGCLVRRACPISQNYGRRPAQSAYHMSHFIR